MAILRTGGADRTTPEASPPDHSREVAPAITPHKGAKIPPVRSSGGPGVDDSRPSAMRNSIDKLCDPFLSHNIDRQDGSRSARVKAPARQSGARAAAITSQPASVPPQRGVPFLAGDLSHSITGKGAPSEEPPPLGPMAPREEVRNLIRERNICY